MKPKAYIDPIVEEIHKARQEHAAKFDYDLRALVREYQRRQKLSGKKIVSFIDKDDHPVVQTQRYEKQELVEHES